MKFGVIVFPGSNCDTDCYHALTDALGQEARYIWHTDQSLAGLDAVVLPGGFSYGDYLRSGAIARFSPVMDAVRQFAETGRPVIGICNGFQVLLEAGLLPGAMRRNQRLHFVCTRVRVRVENASSIFTNRCKAGQVLDIPVAHMEGNYYIDPAGLDELQQAGQILLRYCSDRGEPGDAFNPNGSVSHIAGIMNRRGNVFGLMPHPERACDPVLGATDGRMIFQSVLTHLEEGRCPA